MEKLKLKRGQIRQRLAPCAKRFGFFSKRQWDPMKILSRSENLSHSVLVRSRSACGVETRGGRAGGREPFGGCCMRPGRDDGTFNQGRDMNTVKTNVYISRAW